jgi:hypothetical protein
MTLRRSVLAALCVLATAPATAAAYTPAPAAFELSAAGKRALSARSLSLATVPKSSGTMLLGTGTFKVGTDASIELKGTLRFSAGKRKADATRLAVTIGRTRSNVSARLGGKTVQLFTVTPTRPAMLDAAGQRASVAGARIALTKAAAARLKTALKLKRTPPTSALGKLTVAVAPAPQPQIAPAPAPAPATTFPAPAPTAEPTATPTATATATPTATATAVPTATVTPGPNLPCDATRFAATPADVLDWFGCDLAGSQDLKSWTSYIQSTAFPEVPCTGPFGTVVPGGGASEVVAGDRDDHRFPILSSTVRADGSATIVTSGDVSYRMFRHGIDEAIGTLRIEILAGGTSGTVYASGRYKPFSMGTDTCTAAPLPYADQAVLTLDLSAVTPTTSGGVKRWVHVPATIAAGAGDRIGGGNYGTGRPWGSFTIAIPEP